MTDMVTVPRWAAEAGMRMLLGRRKDGPRAKAAEALREAFEKADRPCSCAGRRWVKDENWTWAYPDIPQEPVPRDGLIPCGFCNFAGWDTPENEPAED